jgi:hypothetical protein
MGVAFTPRIMWRKLGYVASERKENHGRMIPQWQLKEGARGMA